MVSEGTKKPCYHSIMQKINFLEPVQIKLELAGRLSDHALADRLSHLAKHETEVTLAFLLDLIELDRRGIHIQKGFPSLFSYLTENLKMPKGSAHIRIQTARAMRDLPELTESIRNGTVSMSSAAKAQTFFEKAQKAKQKREKEEQNKREKEQKQIPAEDKEGKKALPEGDLPATNQKGDQVSNNGRDQDIRITRSRSSHDLLGAEGKRRLFEQISGKSARETESLLADLNLGLSGEAEQRKIPLVEKDTALGDGFRRISLTADSELIDMLQRLREVISHQNASPTYLELLKKVCTIALEKLDPLLKAKRATIREERKQALRTQSDTGTPLPSAGSTKNLREAIGIEVSDSKPLLPQHGQARRKPIPASVNHAVWARDHGVCQYVDPASGRICGARSRIERQHIVPIAHGGSNSIQNLVLHCKKCNLKASIADFGPKKMKEYLQSNPFPCV